MNYKAALNKLFNDKNMELLLKGSSVNFMAKCMSLILGFYASYVIATVYGASLVGVVATITSAFTLMATISLLGNQTYILKLIPAYVESHDHTVARGILGKVRAIFFVSAALLSVMWIFLETISSISLLPGLKEYTLLVVFLSLITGYKRINKSTLRGLGDYKIFSLFEILPSLALAILVIVSVSIGISESLFKLVYFIPHVLVGISSFYFVSKLFRKHIKNNDSSSHDLTSLPGSFDIVRNSTPMLGIALSSALIANTDILMLNYYTSSETVGIYSIYIKIISVAAIATQAINTMFAPTVSRLFVANEHKALKSFAKKTTLTAFVCSTLLFVLIVLIHTPLLNFYGDIFLTERPTLIVLLLSSLTVSFFGPVGFFLNMTGAQKSFLKIMIFAAAANVLLNLFLIPIFGALGAGLSTLIAVMTWNILATYKVYKTHSYTLIWTGSKNHGSN